MHLVLFILLFLVIIGFLGLCKTGDFIIKYKQYILIGLGVIAICAILLFASLFVWACSVAYG